MKNEMNDLYIDEMNVSCGFLLNWDYWGLVYGE